MSIEARMGRNYTNRISNGLAPVCGYGLTLAIAISALIAVSILACSHVSAGSSGGDNLSVTTKSGEVLGLQLKSGIRMFKGIPFAAPPVGKLRWKPPQAVKVWAGVKKTQAFGPACPQPDMSKLTFTKYKKMAEDCLYLNVWTPAKKNTDKLAVMVWIHGGGFISGSASDNFYDGQDLARKNVVVVTFNYRIGPLGFLAHPLLSKESKHGVSGNYGLLDQIAALGWIQENIAAFGGDPGRVTVFGESGGGRSVAHLLISPQSKGLFHGAIMQSSAVYRPIQHLRESWYQRPGMEKVGEQIAKQLGSSKAKDPIANMRAKTVDEIFAVAKPALAGMSISSKKKKNGFPFEPVADGWVVPDDPSDLFDQQRMHRVPVIVGSNADEGTLFLQKAKNISVRGARYYIKEAFPKYADQVIGVYSLDSEKTNPKDVLNYISGDMNCAAPMRSIAVNMEAAKSKAWLYFFSYVRNDFLGKRLGAWHGSEIRFAFNSLDRGRSRVEERDRTLADVVSSYWINFAKNGDPNGPGLPRWQMYSSKAGHYIEFGEKVTEKQHLKRESLNIFARIEAERRKNRRE
ncbi:MAG: carboxylesterase family protein [Gammaproteobacteria bacterium]|nr:carboxylesterase family protein [Gammaproteobacteria bacterium]